MKGTTVIYVDAFGREHEALVRALNGLNEGYITLVYVDMNAPEPDNLVTKFDIPHMSDDSRQESNPNLPTYHVNCWKEYGQSHNALPGDHPQFDHPYKLKDVDENAQIVEPSRPEYDADVKAHQDMMAEVEAAKVKESPSEPQGQADPPVN